VQCTKLRHLTIVTLAIQNKVCNMSYVHLIFSFVLSRHITLTLGTLHFALTLVSSSSFLFLYFLCYFTYSNLFLES